MRMTYDEVMLLLALCATIVMNLPSMCFTTCPFFTAFIEILLIMILIFSTFIVVTI